MSRRRATRPGAPAPAHGASEGLPALDARTARGPEGARTLARAMAWDQELRAVLPACPDWDAWADAAVEAPPDVPALPARTGLWSPVAGLPDAAAWPARRDELRATWRRWLLGEVPERTPASPRVPVEVLAPAGARGLPVLMVASWHRSWAELALERGWAACVVAAGDGADATDALRAAHPGHDGSRLAWRAWALSRALDQLEGDERVDATQVVVGGHSREGKAALIAAAFDERFAAVISSSSGVLGAIPARLCCDRHFGEGVELLTRHYPDWYHPRLRWFAGREQHLPTDAHELLALCAPRPVLVAVAEQDPVESTLAAERAVAAAGEAHALLGAPGAIVLRRRPGDHGLAPGGVASHLAWAEEALAGRRTTSCPPRHAATWAPWRTTAASGVPLASAVAVALGRPPAAAVSCRRGAGPPTGGPAWGEAPDGLAARDLAGPGGLAVRLLVDAAATGPRRLALWLGPGCRATGWWAGYEQAEPLPVALARAGWAVACHDAVGCGSRAGERIPDGWSPLGRMVADAADVLATARGAGELVSPGPPVVAAYGSGALVALHLARTVPLAALALASPTCTDELLAAPATYGLAALLRAVAPVPTLVVDPAWDAGAAAGEVAAACRVGGAHVEHRPVADWHRLSGATRAALVRWLRGAPGRPVTLAA